MSQQLKYRWIRELAEPYLRGYKIKTENSRGLLGYSFFLKPEGAKRAATLGFFVGYLTAAASLDYLRPAPPECLVFVFVEPVRGALHRSQVLDDDGILRWTAGYIAWLMHPPPRFEFHTDRRAALVRHFSMREWPVEKYQHFSRNFFIETLAWLARTGLLRRWRDFAEPRTER